jgi:putative heme iron utilization protein
MARNPESEANPDSQTVRQPGESVLPAQPADFDPVGESRVLLRSIRAGALATLDGAGGWPFASLVSVATGGDGSPLLLLSDLSAHTRNIRADNRVSLLLSRSGKGDPLAHPRLTVTGRAEPSDDEAVRRRFLARHPKSVLYAGFGDFGFFRIAVEGGHLNGGFARAARLSASDLLTPVENAAPLMQAEADAVEHMNRDHADALRLHATRLLGLPDGPWRVTGLDPDGCDLVLREETARLAFPQPVSRPEELRRVLEDLADAARRAG